MLTILDKCNDNLIGYILRKLGVQTDEQDAEHAKVRYSLQVIVSECEKMIALLVLFGLAGKLPEFLVILFTLGSIRVFVGGYHCKTVLGCLICTFSVFASVMMLAQVMIIPEWGYEAIMLAMIIMIWKMEIQSERRLCYTYSQKLMFKAKALTILVVLSRIVEYVSPEYANIMIITMMFQIVEVSIIYVKQKKLKETKGGTVT